MPLIESMYLDLPVMAYGVSGVPATMGNAGILFYQKEYERLAELVYILVADKALRNRIISRQQQQLQQFLEPNVQQQFYHYLHQIGFQETSAHGMVI